MNEQKPLLTVGIIFKNEIRCLERCMSSVQAIKKLVPCEIVAADTGSDDGSHEIAEKYADVFFDFPWINDFAAARNAVMDRASGEWFLTMDADEWMDEDMSELAKFLRSPRGWGKIMACAVNIRNYTRYDLTGDYSDFIGGRLVRMSSGVRYEGAIHEHYSKDVGGMHVLGHTVLHHDGYVGFGGEGGAAKRERNMTLLRKQLAEDPDNLITRLQCIESSMGSEQIEYMRNAVKGVEDRLELWDSAGPAIYRYAVSLSMDYKLPECQEWLDKAWEMFPDSMFTRIDIGYMQFYRYLGEKRYDDAIPLGKGYLKALNAYRTQGRTSDLLFSSLIMISHNREEKLRVDLAELLYERKRYSEAKGILLSIDMAALTVENFLRCIVNLMNIHSHSEENLSQVMVDVWSRLSKIGDGGIKKNTLLSVVKSLFSTGTLNAEDKNGYRHACTLFVALEGKCWPGDAAALITKRKAAALDKILARYDDWTQLPNTSIVCALEHGATFPLPERPLNVEEMDSFAAFLTQDGNDILPLTFSTAGQDLSDTQRLCWARTLVMAAVKAFDWKNGSNGKLLAQTFARVEKEFLSVCYSPDVLNANDIFLLPPMHRFGWYCVKAFDALNNGDSAGYIRLLREGLASCPDMKEMAEFLFADMERQQQEKAIHDAPPELIQLAESVRTILSQYSPSDPAVQAIKMSSVYKKVAWLIENPVETAAAPAGVKAGAGEFIQ